MPLECDGKEFLEFKGNYLQKAFTSKIKRRIPYTKVTKFLPLDSRGNLCNSVRTYHKLSRDQHRHILLAKVTIILTKQTIWGSEAIADLSMEYIVCFDQFRRIFGSWSKLT